jgi:serine/threonine protein kinase
MERMNHPNIVKLFETIETRNHVVLIMEYAEAGSLHSFLKSKPNRRCDEEDAKKFMKQCLAGLHYCHTRNIAHRDIKLENLLLQGKGILKIIDFGFSTCIPSEKKVKMFCGTPSYMAPEIVTKKEYIG